MTPFLSLRRDPHFNLNDFLRSLRSEVKSWRRVFWRLWGMTHPLYCSLCSAYFPVYLNEFCSFHPQDPEFPTIQFKNSTQPFGVYPCCETPAFRFQPAPNSSSIASSSSTASSSSSSSTSGCQARDHRVRLKSDLDSAVYRILMAHREAICVTPVRKTGIKLPSSDANSVTMPKMNPATL